MREPSGENWAERVSGKSWGCLGGRRKTLSRPVFTRTPVRPKECFLNPFLKSHSCGPPLNGTNNILAASSENNASQILRLGSSMVVIFFRVLASHTCTKNCFSKSDVNCAVKINDPSREKATLLTTRSCSIVAIKVPVSTSNMRTILSLAVARTGEQSGETTARSISRGCASSLLALAVPVFTSHFRAIALDTIMTRWLSGEKTTVGASDWVCKTKRSRIS